MNKSELVEKIKTICGDKCSKACAERALNNVLLAIMEGVRDDKSVQLIGFGTFSVVRRAARTGVNPKTHAKIQIPASKTVKFKVGSMFKSLAS
ncbi:MAG: HU family DNA-binding protein [Puniceicoccales bacterium]|nr:HU family DNA-binding protein [Puniceicoccales bacterium]